MEWFIIIVGALALLALGARLWLRFDKIDWEDSPVFPCLIAIPSEGCYISGWSKAGYPEFTAWVDEAIEYKSNQDYKGTVARLRELGYQPMWKCSPRGFKAD